jgi:uncharacterized phage protein (TIGR01671 family)
MEQREIKFRFWDKDHMGYDVSPVFKNNSLNGGIKSLIEDGYILMQYTGLKDKDGKEIYVKDLLSEKWKVEVYQHKNTGAFMVKFHNNPTMNKPQSLYQYLKDRELARTPERDCIVIGNTIQDKHLLT